MHKHGGTGENILHNTQLIYRRVDLKVNYSYYVISIPEVYIK